MQWPYRMLIHASPIPTPIPTPTPTPTPTSTKEKCINVQHTHSHMSPSLPGIFQSIRTPAQHNNSLHYEKDMPTYSMSMPSLLSTGHHHLKKGKVIMVQILDIQNLTMCRLRNKS